MKSTPTLTRALTALLAVVPTFFALPARAVPGPTALPFVAVTPCRLVDTRGLAAALPGGGSVPPATTRNYTIAGACGIPADAKAVSLNATVTNTGGPGFLVLWPKGAAVPPVSTLNFLAGETIANAAVVPLSADGSLSVALGVSGADVILDVNGYYSPLGVVNSVNGLGGNVTLVPGANVTITPGAGTLAISAASGTGPQGPTGPQGVPGPPGGAGPTGPAGTFDAACVLATTTWTQMRDCQLAPATVYNGIPSPTPPNVPSQAFQAQQTAEFGDAITLAGTARKGVSATVLMSNWAKHSDYPGMSAAGFVHPITVSLYSDAAHAAAHTPDVGTFTQNVVMPWRPEPDPTCTNPSTGDPMPTAWRAGNGTCYNGYAFPIAISLGGITLPNTFIYGIAYNTNTWGYAPLKVGGPYESLNVGLSNTAPTVGTDIDSNAVYWNTSTASNYADGGAGGVGTFRLDTNWAPYVPAVKFTAVN